MKYKTKPVSRRTALTLSSLTALTVAACSGKQAASEPGTQLPAAPQAETSDPAPDLTEAPSPSSSPSATASQTVGDPSTPPTSDVDGGASSGPTSATGAPVNTQGRDLTIDDFFEPSRELRQDLFNVATTSGAKGIGAELEGSQGVRAELRLENRFHKLTFKVGQANSSKSSDLILRVGTYRDGKNDQLIDIPFNVVKPLEIDVSNINALKIELVPRPPEGKDPYISGSITAVMFDMRLE